METADKSDWPSQTSGGLLRYVDDKIKWEIGNSESLHKYRFMRLFHRLKIQYLKCKIIHSLQKKRNLVVILKLKEYLLWPFFRFEKQTFTFVASTCMHMCMYERNNFQDWQYRWHCLLQGQQMFLLWSVKDATLSVHNNLFEQSFKILACKNLSVLNYSGCFLWLVSQLFLS